MGVREAGIVASGDAPVFVEREAEVDLVQGAVERAVSGDGSVLFVQGPAGIGKTVLARVCADRADRSGLTVLRARGTALEHDFTHGVVRQLFEARVRAMTPGLRERLLAGPAAYGASLLASDDSARRHSTPGDSDFAAMNGLYWLAANLAAERPLMLVVDDAHWADEASLRFVNYLAGRLSGLPLLVMVAARSDDPGAATDLVQALSTEAGAVLRLPALSPAGTAQVVRSRLNATDSFVAVCHDSSGGNPFLLSELLNAIRADGITADDFGASRVRQLGPQSVARAVMLRLARLPPGATEFARAVAVLGDKVELQDAAALADIPLEPARGLADHLAAAGVLARADPLSFVHPMILEAIAGDPGPGERTGMHARAAGLLHARGASADKIAAHLAASGPLDEPWAVDVLRRAARAASAQGAPEVAARNLERALREELSRSIRGAVLAELGEALWLGGNDPLAAIENLREACELLEDPALLAHATIVLARTLTSVGNAVAASEVLIAALDGPIGFAPATTVELECELGSVGMLNMSLMPHVRERLESFRDRIGDSTEELPMLANLASLTWFFGRAEETVALSHRALGAGRLLRSLGSDSFAFLETIWVMSGSDDIEGARKAAEAGVDDARERGSAFSFVVSSGLCALVAIRGGDVREAEAQVRAATEFPQIPLFARPTIFGILALCLIERGELDEAEASLTEGYISPDIPVLVHWDIGFYARALLRIAQGRDVDALQDLREFARRERLCFVHDNPSVPWRVDAARACLRLGRLEEATALLDEHERLATRWGAPGPQGIGLQGRAALLRGHEQLAALEQALALLKPSPRRLDEARVLFDLGVALRREGRRRDAQRRLSEAISLARRIGATVLATRGNDELGVLQARPRRLQFSGVESLTASERRVALMAAEGMTNPQIAQALFVTSKTVENHLSHVYIKLAIKSRSQLPAALDTVEN